MWETPSFIKYLSKKSEIIFDNTSNLFYQLHNTQSNQISVSNIERNLGYYSFNSISYYLYNYLPVKKYFGSYGIFKNIISSIRYLLYDISSYQNSKIDLSPPDWKDLLEYTQRYYPTMTSDIEYMLKINKTTNISDYDISRCFSIFCKLHNKVWETLS